MVSEITLKSLYQSLQNEMIAQADFSESFTHPVDKGDNSEENWKKWFDNYLPDRYRANKATIIDSKGSVSDQIDIVIYDKQYSYLAFNQNGILYIPAESVYAVFEVKQKLNAKNFKYAENKIESVRSLFRTSASIPYAAGKYPPKPLHRIMSGILTTSSEWEPMCGNPLKKYLLSSSKINQIDCGCVLNEGSFFCDYENNIIMNSGKEESLVYFYLKFLDLLQQLGTVPAIELEQYMKSLNIKKEIINV